jgi:hypothetical protein
MSNGQNGRSFVQMNGGFPLLTPIINNGGKGKKKKSVKFLTYVQVRKLFSYFRLRKHFNRKTSPGENNLALKRSRSMLLECKFAS